MPRWDADAKFKLLLAIHQVKNPSPPDWDEVAKLLGPDVTAEACRQQFKVIKKAAGKELSLEASRNNSETVTTPSHKHKLPNSDQIEDDDEEPKESPPKKTKRGKTVKPATPKIKMEDGEVEGSTDTAI